jgi:branched-chain amino acid transport system permease protein
MTERLAKLRANPAMLWVGVTLVAVTLLTLPFALAAIGTAWVRIMNLAILFTLLSLGLNIVVGYAGLLDLGYIAFYGVGAYTYALLASPQLNIHLPFWIILPIGGLVACVFGVLLGAPTLRLRGDYLAIVTLGFGEIVPRVFRNAGIWTGGVPGISALVGMRTTPSRPLMTISMSAL